VRFLWWPPMSGSGQKRKRLSLHGMSALPSRANIVRQINHHR
jgi:hypothetical protein